MSEQLKEKRISCQMEKLCSQIQYMGTYAPFDRGRTAKVHSGI